MHLVISKNLWLSTKQPDPCRILALQNWSVHTHTHRLRIYSAVPVLHGFSLSEVNILSYLMFLKHPDIYFWQTLSAESSMSCQSPIILDSEFLGDDLMLFPCLYDCRNHLAPNQADSVSTSARPVSAIAILVLGLLGWYKHRPMFLLSPKRWLAPFKLSLLASQSWSSNYNKQPFYCVKTSQELQNCPI